MNNIGLGNVPKVQTSKSDQDRQHVITIFPANMRRLEDVYGARTDRCKAKIINDILQRGLDEIEKAHSFV